MCINRKNTLCLAAWLFLAGLGHNAYIKGTYAFPDGDHLPPIHICPPDSTMISGECKCNHIMCDPPSCDKILNLLTNSTEIPGECCASYSCDECAKDGATGNCTCPDSATLNDEGECECKDIQNTFINGECVCDKTKCPPVAECDNKSVPVKVLSGCCVTVQCKICPQDSHRDIYNTDEIEDKCVCFPCAKPLCEDFVVIKKGRSFPGSCCDLYECVNKTTCLINGTQYADGVKWVAPDGGTCTCQSGISLCDPKPAPITETALACTYAGKIYPHHSSWASDSCTNCTCYNGSHKCIAHLCNVDEINCPSLSTCNKICENGYKQKNGCKICKCLPRTKYWNLEKLMESNNLTEADVYNIVEDNLIFKTYVSTNTEATTTTTKPICEDRCDITMGIIYVFSTIGVLLFIVVLCAIIYYGYLFCKKKWQCGYSPIKKKPIDTSRIVASEMHPIRINKE